MFGEEGEIKEVIIKFILKLNTLYHSCMFTSSRITREILKLKKIKKTYFPKIHKLVKQILKSWANERICSIVSKTKLGRSKKTKISYRFTDNGFKKLKLELVNETIKIIKNRAKRKSFSQISRRSIIEKQHKKHLYLL